MNIEYSNIQKMVIHWGSSPRPTSPLLTLSRPAVKCEARPAEAARRELWARGCATTAAESSAIHATFRTKGTLGGSTKGRQAGGRALK